MSIPGAGNPLLLGAAGGYKIERSLRFNSADSAYLSRTLASAGNRKTWSYSFWLKRSAISVEQWLLNNYVNFASGGGFVRFNSNSTLQWGSLVGATWGLELNTTQAFRDTSAWYHFLFVLDTTQATASDRAKFYVNGSQVTAFSTAAYPSQNADLEINRSGALYLDGENGAGNYFSGYLADIHFIDGQALDPSSFGEFDDNGIWQPKAFSGGSYGTNGFKLAFADNSAATATTLGKDTSGNGNNWTPNNLSVTAGAGNDSLVDTPTNYGTDTGAGGEVRGNYCTWNPADKNTNVTLANGNLDMSQSASGAVRGTIGVSSGKWYWEVVAGSGNTVIGVTDGASALGTYVGSSPKSVGWAQADLFFVNGVTGVGTGDPGPYTAGDTIGVALNMDAGTVQFYKNNTLCSRSASGLTGTWFPAIGTNVSATTSVANFGQRPFAYTAPSGFKALCTTNLPTPTIADPSTAMDVVTYTGNGSTQTISGLGFSPDLVWIKRRTGTVNHVLTDTVRGAALKLASNVTDAEAGTDNGYLSAFTTDGFTVAQGGGLYPGLETNGNLAPYVAWTWDAGSSTVTNTAGTISSQVRANPSAGFSIVTYSSGPSGSTVGHGLGVAPGMIIAKCRTVGSTAWIIYHQSLGANSYMIFSTNPADSYTGYWGSPSSTTFGVSNTGFLNNTGNMVAYCFAPVAGYSAFGSYTGNGSSTDGPFIFTGFRPSFVLIKRTDGTSTDYVWWITDSKRGSYNPAANLLQANSADAENSGSLIDLLSNGFKLRNGSGSVNGSGGTFIYAAFAESPFQYARAR